MDSLEAAGVRWNRVADSKKELKELWMTAEHPEKLTLHESQPLTAQVSLKDGRRLEVRVSVLTERPKLVLMSKSIDPADSPIHLDSADDLPVNARLHFRLKSEKPGAFGKAEKVEVASDDGFYHTELSLENGGLMRQNAHTVMATLEIDKDAAPSTFGALRFRPVSEEGFGGDWQPLATLVRLPELSELHCPAQKKEVTCTLSGNNLFLIEAIASDARFQHATPVSESAMDTKVEVPRPTGKRLYLKLRDDPSVIHTLEMPVNKDAPTTNKEAASKEDKPSASSREKVSNSANLPVEAAPH